MRGGGEAGTILPKGKKKQGKDNAKSPEISTQKHKKVAKVQDHRAKKGWHLQRKLVGTAQGGPGRKN